MKRYFLFLVSILSSVCVHAYFSSLSRSTKLTLLDNNFDVSRWPEETVLSALQSKTDYATHYLTTIIYKCQQLTQSVPILGIVIDPIIDILVNIVKPFTRGIVKWVRTVMNIRSQIEHGNFSVVELLEWHWNNYQHTKGT